MQKLFDNQGDIFVITWPDFSRLDKIIAGLTATFLVAMVFVRAIVDYFRFQPEGWEVLLMIVPLFVGAVFVVWYFDFLHRLSTGIDRTVFDGPARSVTLFPRKLSKAATVTKSLSEPDEIIIERSKKKSKRDSSPGADAIYLVLGGKEVQIYAADQSDLTEVGAGELAGFIARHRAPVPVSTRQRS